MKDLDHNDVKTRIRKVVEKNLRKTVHFDFSYETHATFRVACVKRNLSMQEVIEELASRVGREDPYMCDLLDMLVKRKVDATLQVLSDTDIETVYNVLEQVSPLRDE